MRMGWGRYKQEEKKPEDEGREQRHFCISRAASRPLDASLDSVYVYRTQQQKDSSQRLFNLQMPRLGVSSIKLPALLATVSE